MAIAVHPTSTAGSGRRFRQVLNKQRADKSDNLYIPCPHCGYPNRIDRDNSNNKEGEGIQQISVTQAVPGGSETFTEARRSSGCLFCKLDYTKSTYRKPLFSGIDMAGR